MYKSLAGGVGYMHVTRSLRIFGGRNHAMLCRAGHCADPGDGHGHHRRGLERDGLIQQWFKQSSDQGLGDQMCTTG